MSDSGDLKGAGGAVYKITPQGKVSAVLSGKKDARVQAPYGLLIGKTANCIYMVDFVSGVLYRIDMKKDEMVEVAKGFGGGDGIVKDSKAKDSHQAGDVKIKEFILLSWQADIP